MSTQPDQPTSNLNIESNEFTSLGYEFTESNNDLNLHIAIRKGANTCTKHPLSHCMLYGNLSPSIATSLILAFTSRMSCMENTKKCIGFSKGFTILSGRKLFVRNWELLWRIRRGRWWIYLEERRLLAANGCLQSNIDMMNLLKGTKRVWLPKDLFRPMVLTTLRPLHQ